MLKLNHYAAPSQVYTVKLKCSEIRLFRQSHEVNDPVLEKRCIKIDARDISIFFSGNTTIKFKDVPANAPATNPALRFYNTQYHNTTALTARGCGVGVVRNTSG